MNKTLIYCPSCKLLTISNVEDENENGRLRQKRVSMAGHVDIQVFQRIRACTKCGHRFTTGEVAYDLLEELVVLREHFDVTQETREQLKARWKAFAEAFAAVAETIPKFGGNLLGPMLRRTRSKRHQREIMEVIKSRNATKPDSAA